MISIDEARRLILSSCKAVNNIESISLQSSTGYSIAECIYADRDYPPFNRSTMDGFALNSGQYKKDKSFPIERELLAGQESGKLLDPNNCIKIMTGASVPEGADLVIPIEDAKINNDSVTFNLETVQAWKNIALKGEDKKESELIIDKETEITPFAQAILSSIGKGKVQVYAKPKLAIISTGDEVVPIDTTPKDYQIRDSNSYSTESFLFKYGIKPELKKLVNDDKAQLKSVISESLNMDIIIISGGVSMGDADFVPDVLNELAVKKIFHKVNIKPGKPLWFGVSNKTAVFGVPGNPSSVQVIFKIFIEPYIRQFMKLPQLFPIKLKLGQKHISKGKRDFFFPAKIESKNGESYLIPLSNKGSGDIKALFSSHGLINHPGEKELLEENELMDFYPWSPLW